MTFKSNVSYNAGSFKTVVPMGLVKLLNIEHGDQLTWEVDIKEDSAVIQLTPVSKKQ